MKLFRSYRRYINPLIDGLEVYSMIHGSFRIQNWTCTVMEVHFLEDDSWIAIFARKNAALRTCSALRKRRYRWARTCGIGEIVTVSCTSDPYSDEKPWWKAGGLRKTCAHTQRHHSMTKAFVRKLRGKGLSHRLHRCMFPVFQFQLTCHFTTLSRNL